MHINIGQFVVDGAISVYYASRTLLPAKVSSLRRPFKGIVTLARESRFGL